MHLFYYGTWLMSALSLISVLAIYRNNRRVIRDIKRIPAVKDKWLFQFLQEYQRCGKEDAAIHNPGIYLAKRMRGRKIGPVTLRQMKGISWYTFALSFLCAGAGIFMLRRTGLEKITFPFLEREYSAMGLLIITAGGAGVILLLLRMVLALGYQEEMIETNLLDYMENPQSTESKVIQMESTRQSAPAVKPKKQSRRKARKQEKIPQENLVQAQKERARTDRREQEREKKAEQVEERIREAAATDERYSHLLNKEEEAIVKDVIKEFLS